MESMPAARVLVVNPGSSSLKLSVLGADDATLAEREGEHPGDGGGGLDDFGALHADDFDAAGRRGGPGGGGGLARGPGGAPRAPRPAAVGGRGAAERPSPAAA